jgi:hypothetical protein
MHLVLIQVSSSNSFLLGARDRSIQRLSDRDLTSVLLVRRNVVVQLFGLGRKIIGYILALSLLSHELNDCSLELQNFVLDLSVLPDG